MAPRDNADTSGPALPNFRVGTCGVSLCCFAPAAFGSFESAFAFEAKTEPKPATPIVFKKFLLLNSLLIDNSP
jgi:hypothetical protein